MRLPNVKPFSRFHASRAAASNQARDKAAKRRMSQVDAINALTGELKALPSELSSVGAKGARTIPGLNSVVGPRYEALTTRVRALIDSVRKLPTTETDAESWAQHCRAASTLSVLLNGDIDSGTASVLAEINQKLLLGVGATQLTGTVSGRLNAFDDALRETLNANAPTLAPGEAKYFRMVGHGVSLVEVPVFSSKDVPIDEQLTAAVSFIRDGGWRGSRDLVRAVSLLQTITGTGYDLSKRRGVLLDDERSFSVRAGS